MSKKVFASIIGAVLVLGVVVLSSIEVSYAQSSDGTSGKYCNSVDDENCCTGGTGNCLSTVDLGTFKSAK